jgi:hypothetical protein
MTCVGAIMKMAEVTVPLSALRLSLGDHTWLDDH